jgi:hypothetical protein
MTTQTHTLALKIDAAAAKTGSREFTAAVAAVKKAVEDLDRDSTGLFTKLRNIKPQVDVTPIAKATTATRNLSTAM